MAKSNPKILKVGVTGGIGSGKSLVCSFFEKQGVPVLYADLIARDISDTDERVKKSLVALLGKDAYHPDGQLNRTYVASRVFGKKTLHEKVNRLIHPVVYRKLQQQYRALAKEGHTLVVVEAALIYEAGLDKQLDVVVVVEADEHSRIVRVMERDKTTEDQVRQRLNAQWKSSDKVKQADFVIYNNGTKDELMERVKFLHHILQQMSTQ